MGVRKSDAFVRKNAACGSSRDSSVWLLTCSSWFGIVVEIGVS